MFAYTPGKHYNVCLYPWETLQCLLISLGNTTMFAYTPGKHYNVCLYPRETLQCLLISHLTVTLGPISEIQHLTGTLAFIDHWSSDLHKCRIISIIKISSIIIEYATNVCHYRTVIDDNSHLDPF